MARYRGPISKKLPRKFGEPPREGQSKVLQQEELSSWDGTVGVDRKKANLNSAIQLNGKNKKPNTSMAFGKTICKNV